MPTKADATALVLAESTRRAQVHVRQQMVSDVSRVWAVLNFDRLQQTWPSWLEVMLRTLRRYHSQSADEAALFYRATRQLELGDPGEAKLADPPSEEWVSRALGYAAPGAYQRQIAAKASPEQANRSALVQTLGTSSRIAMDGHRTTIEQSAKADRAALGYYRVTDGDPCAFCALMASRGMVYKNEDTAGARANDSFTGPGLFKFHNDCGCTIAPGFKRGVALTGVAAEAAKVYENRGEGDALAAFRKAWNNRHAA